MTRVRSTLLVASLGALVCAALAACLDLTPLIYEAAPPETGPPPSSDAGLDVVDLGDAAVDGDAFVDVDNRPPCVRCITTPDDASSPGCADEIAACRASPVCDQIYLFYYVAKSSQAATKLQRRSGSGTNRPARRNARYMTRRWPRVVALMRPREGAA